MQYTWTTTEKIELLRERFVHREDTYAIQWLSRESNEWRFWRVTNKTCSKPLSLECSDGKCNHKVSVPLTTASIRQHIEGTKTVGVYQLANDDTVKWLCLDIDIDGNNPRVALNISAEQLRRDVQEHTRKLVARLKTFGCPFLVEDSGNRGYHIWVFFTEPVNAKYAMSFGRYINQQDDPPPHLHVEVFPKQIGERTFGNLVKMPLGIHQKTSQPTQFVNSWFKPYSDLDQWDLLENVQTVSEESLLWVINEAKISLIESIRLDGAAGAGKLGLPCLTKMMEEGVGEGRRDISAHKLSCMFRTMGVPRNMAVSALEEWNAKNSPPIDIPTLTLKVISGYNNNYTHFPCQEVVLDSFCSSDCRFYEEKMRTRAIKNGTK